MNNEQKTESTAKFLGRWTFRILAAAIAFLASIPIWNNQQPERSTQRSTQRRPTVVVPTEAEANATAERIQKLWDEFLDLHSAELRRSYLDGATEEEILKLEDAYGVRLPADYRAFLKICNGTRRGYSSVYPPPFSVDAVLWKGTLNNTPYKFDEPLIIEYPNKPIIKSKVLVSNFWHPSLLLLANKDGVGVAIDLTDGRIIHWNRDGRSCSYICDSFEEFLRLTVETTERGGSPIWWGCR